MSKQHHANRESKKPAKLTAKEKKAAKRDKKRGAVPPSIGKL